MSLAMRVSERVGSALEKRTSRRGLLTKAALAGTALAVAPVDYLIRPADAFQAICGPDNTADQGYTVFCCSLNDGVNECPPGTFAGGWWKADASPYCCVDGKPSARYYIDCQAECSHCSGGSFGHFCSPGCSSCQCHNGSGSCDRRRVCCAQFRYGQCHTEIDLCGAVACRVVTCTPPYELFDSCSASAATDNSTALHTAPCLSPAGC